MAALLRGIRFLLQSSVHTVNWCSVITLLFLVDTDFPIVFYYIPYHRSRHSDMSSYFRVAMATFVSFNHINFCSDIIMSLSFFTMIFLSDRIFLSILLRAFLKTVRSGKVTYITAGSSNMCAHVDKQVQTGVAVPKTLMVASTSLTLTEFSFTLNVTWYPTVCSKLNITFIMTWMCMKQWGLLWTALTAFPANWLTFMHKNSAEILNEA